MPATVATPQVDAATEAYVWGYPLVVMHRTRALHASRTGLGVLEHVAELATAANRTVVAPNNDTLYSSGWFDLSAGDLVIEVPPMDHPGRYWSVMVLDAYTHVAYACRRLHGTDGAVVRVTYDPSTPPSLAASEVLTVATPTVWILARVLVDGPDDIEACRAVQRAITVAAPARHPTGRVDRRGRPTEVHTAGAGFFGELAAALAIDPPAPWHPQPAAETLAIAAGEHTLDDEQLAEAVARGEQRVVASFGQDRRINGWGTRPSGTDFGDDALLRATCAKFGLAGHHPVENRSYVASGGGPNHALHGGRGRRLQFPPGAAPPCDGFWSLTVYGSDLFLVENEIDRYSIGDRTPGLRRGVEGELTLEIGGPRPSDPSNWLPAPAGPYHLVLRVYEGHGPVVDASWFPPPLVD